MAILDDSRMGWSGILGSCTRKLGQRPSDLPILEPPQRFLVCPNRENEIDPVRGIEVARLKSERRDGKTSGNPAKTTRVKYGTDSGRPGNCWLRI